MGLDDAAAYQAIRFSLGRYTTEEEVDFVIQRVKMALNEMQSQIIPMGEGIKN